jgi:zinc protease
MNFHFRRLVSIVLGILLSLSALQQASAAPAENFSVPVTYFKLPNGLKVVLSPDSTAPTVAIAVYYKIGFRIEPKDRTGFAHLFEHMMFQGTPNLNKLDGNKLIQGNGGIQNGSTRFDFTNYFEILPSHKLEMALWYESDRMRGLNITQENLKNQQGVVGNEVKLNVINTPYGGFPWLDMPQYANTNWYNAHNFYGDLKDIEAATLKDVQDFFSTYYVPNNAVLTIVGDFDVAQTRKMVEKYFGNIPSAKQPPAPELAEPKQDQEKRATKKDPLAKRPALAFAYHMPERNTPEYYAMGLLDQILLQGEDGLLYQELVKKRGFTASIPGGINLLGNLYNYNGPMLWMGYLFHDNGKSPDEILSAVDTVIEGVQSKPIDQKTLTRALVKLRSSFYDTLSATNGFGRADLLSSLALFDDNPQRINTLEAEFRKVTPELLQRTAREYLRKTNRTVLVIEPASGR